MDRNIEAAFISVLLLIGIVFFVIAISVGGILGILVTCALLLLEISWVVKAVRGRE